MHACFVYMTVGTREAADDLANHLLGARLAACVNIIGTSSSQFWWEGKVQQAEEIVLVAKTRADLVNDITTTVKRLNNYVNPCVIAFPIVAGNPDYVRWILNETRPPSEHDAGLSLDEDES